jgi:hypothetical protein
MLPLFAVALVGCKSGEFADYVFPRVTGRVIAADTRQPLADVKVRRGALNQNQNNYSDPFGPPKGGQIMERTPAVRTDADGRFVLDSERVLSLFHHTSWFSVTISFEHYDYASFETNYTSANISGHTPDGAPLVKAGDILLLPAPR